MGFGGTSPRMCISSYLCIIASSFSVSVSVGSGLRLVRKAVQPGPALGFDIVSHAVRA